MKKNNTISFFKKLFLIGYISFIQFDLTAQPPEIFKVKRNNSLIYFFQKNDTGNVIKEKVSDLFYFLVPDSLKEQIVLEAENGTFYNTSSDSLFRFKYLRGLKYELKFQKSASIDGSIKKVDYKVIQGINGASLCPRGTVVFRVFNKNDKRVLIENRFLFEESD